MRNAGNFSGLYPYTESYPVLPLSYPIMNSTTSSGSETYPFTIPGLSYPKIVEQIDDKANTENDDKMAEKQITTGNYIDYMLVNFTNFG